MHPLNLLSLSAFQGLVISQHTLQLLCVWVNLALFELASRGVMCLRCLPACRILQRWHELCVALKVFEVSACVPSCSAKLQCQAGCYMAAIFSGLFWTAYSYPCCSCTQCMCIRIGYISSVVTCQHELKSICSALTVLGTLTTNLPSPLWKHAYARMRTA